LSIALAVPFVRDDQQRLVVLREEPIEHADNARARQRGVDFGRETGPGELILDIEYAEATAAFEHVGDEVEHPDLVRPACRLKRRTRAKCPLAAPPPTNHQALLSIQPIDLLQVHHVALSASPFA
jgi:hypothetical protein